MNSIPALYVHIPFCSSICSYCDFCKMIKNKRYEEKYLEELMKEIINRCNNQYETIYIGGGTPSCLELPLLEKLLKLLEGYLVKGSEFTIEANPESCTEQFIALLNKYHVNRVSLGVQTFDAKGLTYLNRHHTYKDVKKATERLKLSGIKNFNLDLIYGYEGEVVATVLKDLEEAVGLFPTHISFYGLQIEEGTVLFNKKATIDDDNLASLYETGVKFLEEHGYKRYEVSNFSVPNYESIHNLTYWHDLEYVGVGLGAAGYEDGIRYHNSLSLTTYLQGKWRKSEEKVTGTDEIFEYIMLNLRLEKGLLLKDYQKRFKESFVSTHLDFLESVKDLVILDEVEGYLKVKNLYLLDLVLEKLL